MVKVAAMEEEKQGHRIKLTKPLKLIEKTRARKLSYENRKHCVLKKTMELSILCGIKACTVCIGPDGDVQTWPENRSEVRNVIDSWKQNKKTKPGHSVDCLKPLDQNFGFSGEKAGEGSENLGVKKEGFERFLLGFDSGWINGLSMDSLEVLSRDLEGKLEELTTRIGFLEKVNGEKKILGSEDLVPYWFGVDAPVENFDMVSSGSGFCQPLQNPGLDSLSNTFHPLQTMVGFDDPLSSVTPMWPSDNYTDNTFGFGSLMWPLDAVGGFGRGGDNGRFSWSYGGGVGKSDLSSMTSYGNQFLASPSSLLDEVVMGSMFVDGPLMVQEKGFLIGSS